MDRAAFFMALGGQLTRVDGKYPDCRFQITTHRFVVWYEKHIGWVPYRVFCEKRRDIKRKTRKMAGLPEHFTGDNNGKFTFEDIAIVKY